MLLGNSKYIFKIFYISELHVDLLVNVRVCLLALIAGSHFKSQKVILEKVSNLCFRKMWFLSKKYVQNLFCNGFSNTHSQIMRVCPYLKLILWSPKTANDQVHACLMSNVHIVLILRLFLYHCLTWHSLSLLWN